jgi:Flp pilus assembly protein TadG
MKGGIIRNHREESQTLVEFAVCLPLLALLLFAIIQYGFIFAAFITLRNASAVAARYATLGTTPPPSVSQVQNMARDAIQPMLNEVHLDTPVVDLNASVGGTDGGKSVTLTYNLPLVIPFVVPGRTAEGTLPLTATSVAR